ncbi:hypothetical protein BGZ46_009978 [Entomortierella lignicola]|nr:hypothetical protein BGZ46_009978 [Entomortierella lignicola]
MYESYHQHSASSSTSSRGAPPPATSSSSNSQPASATATTTTTTTTTATSPATVQQQQQQFAQEFWEEQIFAAEHFDSDFKNHPLPLARIKKVMKSDPEVKRSDVASAVSRSDQFDFLIDIVPREEAPKVTKRSNTREDPAPEPEVYDEQQQQQYAQYYPQGPGGLAGYSHAIDPQFYQAVSHDQFQQYMQYQQAYVQQAPTSAPPSGSSHSRNASAGYAQEATSRQS